jgi:7-carboxy-7-deazaguanine synthase
MPKLPIAETFESLQGEGSRIGSPSFFVRVSGCNLRCRWCDTPYASWKPEGRPKTLAELVADVRQSSCSDVVLTGGEPMMFDAIQDLAAALKALGKHVTIETAGTVYRSLPCDLMSISPKLANSAPPADTPNDWHARHEALRFQPDVLVRLVSQYDYQIKFVVAPTTLEQDLAEIEAILAAIPPIDRQRVFLMPEGIEAAMLRQGLAKLAPICRERGFRLGPRLHIELYGNRRGT